MCVDVCVLSEKRPGVVLYRTTLFDCYRSWLSNRCSCTSENDLIGALLLVLQRDRDILNYEMRLWVGSRKSKTRPRVRHLAWVNDKNFLGVFLLSQIYVLCIYLNNRHTHISSHTQVKFTDWPWDSFHKVNIELPVMLLQECFTEKI